MSRPKQRSKSLPECPSNGDGSENIPDVLYAPDGRKFFPCRYCCRAFAFKKGQVSHIKACAFRVFEVNDEEEERTTKKRKIKKEYTEMPVQVKIEEGIVNNYNPYKTLPAIKKESAKTARRRTIATVPVIKFEPKPHQDLVSERVKNLQSISLIPIGKKPAASAAVPVDVSQPTDCRHCGMTFPDALDCLRHKRDVHNTAAVKLSPESLKIYDEVFQKSDKTVCPICMKPTKASSWRRHLGTHSMSLNHVCAICKKGFNRGDHLRQHMKRHLLNGEC